MEVTQVARRYARGLFAVSQEINVSDTINDDFQDVAEICRQDRALLEFLAAPQIGDNDKKKAIAEIFSGKVADQLYHLMQLLVTKHRTSFLVEIAEEYEKLVLESQGIVKTKLVTAVPLSDAEIKRIKARLATLTGKTIEIITSVDAAIIGGAIAFVGDKIIDRSVVHDLRLLKERLLEVKVA
ncbi:MAG: ATP synthase F1 subunit delta [candidate division Zixibacteria bacterium]|nr:ATP synthase F1 subunit delta [candidate division Zixibacteria bacterium]